MNPIKKIAVKTKNHLGRHKFAYGMTAVSILLIKTNVSAMKSYDKFLVSKDINPLEFWNPEMFKELNA
ncbi:MAG TPA: hypothetical protein VLG69_01095 [Candidatus Andersenbacteria bacterium]|nr:hypothetical protein [Candidatus Andersenbacteria bacterium]